MFRQFEWDAAKAGANLHKHGVSFEVAMRVFADPLALTGLDRVERGEQRWQTLGMVDGCLLLLVAHTVLELKADNQAIEVNRLILASGASTAEHPVGQGGGGQ